MNATPSSQRILRRSRVVAWTTAAGASLATLGLIAGVTHTASTAAPTTAGTSTSGSSTSSSTSTNSNSHSTTGVGVVAPNAAPQAGSHGS